MFISFEGIDGSGKSTQAAMLGEHLESLPGSASVLRLREPGGTEAAERIREILMAGEIMLDTTAELLLFEAARADLMRRVLGPALDRGETVICDRFTDSTVAYQGWGREIGAGRVAYLNELATGGLRPAVTFYLKIDPVSALERIPGGDRFELEGPDYLARVADGYEALAEAAPERIVTLDATEAPNEIHRTVLGELRRRFGTPSGAER